MSETGVHPGDGQFAGEPEPAQRLKNAGQRAAERARSEADSQLEKGKDSAAQTASSAAGALENAGSTLAEEGHDTLAQATFALADKLSSLGRYVEDHSINDLTGEAQRIARENPALFVAGGVAIGLALSRFLKASPDAPTYSHDPAGARSSRDDSGWSDGEWNEERGI